MDYHPNHLSSKFDNGNVIDLTQGSLRSRLARAKAAYTTRRVPTEAVVNILGDDGAPAAGDLVLARVTKLGRHEHLELTTGRRSSLFPGDEILVCYGNRYAPDQFEAQIPPRLEPCHLVAAGGIASQALSWHSTISGPTCIEPLGYAADASGRRINLRAHALNPRPAHGPRPYTLAVLGTSMNAGKTTTAAHIIKGAARAGLRVAAAKITGTGAGGDAWLMADAGASLVLDFTDAGLASTYLAPVAELERVMRDLVHQVWAHGFDLAVVEIADGLFQKETAALVTSPVFADFIDGLLFAASDAMGAAAGSHWLRQRGLPLLGITGTLTRSPLACREASSASGEAVFKLSQLHDAGFIVPFMPRDFFEPRVQAV